MLRLNLGMNGGFLELELETHQVVVARRPVTFSWQSEEIAGLARQLTDRQGAGCRHVLAVIHYLESYVNSRHKAAHVRDFAFVSGC